MSCNCPVSRCSFHHVLVFAMAIHHWNRRAQRAPAMSCGRKEKKRRAAPRVCLSDALLRNFGGAARCEQEVVLPYHTTHPLSHPLSMAAHNESTTDSYREDDEELPELTADDIEEIHDDQDDQGDAPMDSDDDDDRQNQEDDKMVINDSSIAAFFSHKGNSIFTISLHPQFPQVPLAISGGADDRAFLWSLPGGEEVQALEPKHSDSVISVGWSHDGKHVATGGMDGMVNVWKVDESTGGWNKWDHVITLEGGEEVQVSAVTASAKRHHGRRCGNRIHKRASLPAVRK